MSDSSHLTGSFDLTDQIGKRLIALLDRLSAEWTSIDTDQADRLECMALYLLCGAGIVELRLAGRAWTDESALDFKATACGVWIDYERKSILPEEVRRAVPAWAKSNVAVQLNPLLEARLTLHGEQTKRDLLSFTGMFSDMAKLFFQAYVCTTPIRGRVSVQIVGNQGPALGTVRRDDVSSGMLAALESIAASQKTIAAAMQGRAVAEQPANPTADLSHDAVQALLRVFTNGIADERIQQAARILVDDTLTTNDKLTRIDELIPFPPTASAEQLGKMLRVSKQAVMKTAWWCKNRRDMTDEEIERRQSRMKERGLKYDRPRSKEDDADER